MKFDVLLYTCDNLFDAGDVGNDLIRIDGLDEKEAVALTGILLQPNVNVCLLPYQED